MLSYSSMWFSLLTEKCGQNGWRSKRNQTRKNVSHRIYIHVHVLCFIIIFIRSIYNMIKLWSEQIISQLITYYICNDNKIPSTTSQQKRKKIKHEKYAIIIPGPYYLLQTNKWMLYKIRYKIGGQVQRSVVQAQFIYILLELRNLGRTLLVTWVMTTRPSTSIHATQPYQAAPVMLRPAQLDQSAKFITNTSNV